MVVMGLVRRVLRFLRRQLRRLNGGVVEELRDGTKIRIGLTGVKILEDGEGSDRDDTVLVSGGREARTRPRNKKRDEDELTGRDGVKHGDGGESMREAGYRNMSESQIMDKALI